MGLDVDSKKRPLSVGGVSSPSAHSGKTVWSNICGAGYLFLRQVEEGCADHNRRTMVTPPPDSLAVRRNMTDTHSKSHFARIFCKVCVVLFIYFGVLFFQELENKFEKKGGVASGTTHTFLSSLHSRRTNE